MHRLLFFISFGYCSLTFAQVLEHDVVVYGGTSAAVMAAVQVKKLGKSVIVISPDKQLGGLSSGGLGWTDTGDKAVIGGLSREFYHRIFKHYNQPSAWRQQKREDYGTRGQGSRTIDGDQKTMWIFEPHVAEKVFDQFIAEHQISVVRALLDRSEGGVIKDGERITALKTLDGKVYRGKIFIDATYEGDLLAAAGISYAVGREGQEVYGEKWNGVQTGVLHHRHHFDTIPNKVRIDPYKVKGDPASGLLPRISADPPGKKHSGDNRVQAYCFRMCLTNHPENRIPFPKPDNYDPAQFELLLRIFDAGWRETFKKFDPIPNHKTDTNNHGPMSTDNIGMNYRYPEGSYEERAAIIKEHKDYQQGWLYFIANDPRVPKEVQKEMRTWGLPKDEYIDNANWSPQLYIREARRMVGHYVMTENELLERKPTPQPIGMGSYTIDSHNVQRYVTPEGYVQNEGDIGVKCNPYQIAYGALVPRKDECTNLFSPVCVLSSHIAFGSIRMEPVFMILGQSAATAAVIAIDDKTAVQDVDYQKLRTELLKQGQILEYEKGPKKISGIDPAKLEGIIVDDHQAKLVGDWQKSSAQASYIGKQYLHDGGKGDGSASAIYTVKLPEGGWYEVSLSYSANKNRATNVPVVIAHHNGESKLSVNQQEKPPIDQAFTYLGAFEFSREAIVKISNAGTNGHVVIDSVQLVPVE